MSTVLGVDGVNIEVDACTHVSLKRLSGTLRLTMAETVSLAVRRLRQQKAGTELASPLTVAERAWLGADLD